MGTVPKLFWRYFITNLVQLLVLRIIKMIGMRVILLCQIIFLGLILSGDSEGCRDMEYWCNFVKHDLAQCRRYHCIANICKKTCGKCPECTTNGDCPAVRPICRGGKCVK